jgi:threonine synthase
MHCQLETQEISLRIGRAIRNTAQIACAHSCQQCGDSKLQDLHPASWQQALDARDSSGGLIDAVTDKEILAAYHLIASREGIFVEPSSAAGLAGLIKYQKAGKLPKNKTIVITVTGHGLKDIPWALEGAKKPVVVPVSVKAAAKALGLS